MLAGITWTVRHHLRHRPKVTPKVTPKRRRKLKTSFERLDED